MAEAPEKSVGQQLADLENELREFRIVFRGVLGKTIAQLAEARREIKALRRTQRKQRKTGDAPQPRKPASFETPAELSDELCDFLRLERGAKMSQNQVTAQIQKYCQRNGLLDPQNRTIILPDERMKGILRGVPAGLVLTWFNLQRYVKHHYQRGQPVANTE